MNPTQEQTDQNENGAMKSARQFTEDANRQSTELATAARQDVSMLAVNHDFGRFNPREVQTFNDMMTIAKAMSVSGLLGNTMTTEAILTKMMIGQQYGMAPVEAISGLHIIEGKPTLDANRIAARVKSHPRYDYKVRHWDTNQCRLEFFEDGEPLGEMEYSLADANRAGLTNKGTWQKYPKAMLFARAISQGARAYCPDIYDAVFHVADEIEEELRPAPQAAPAQAQPQGNKPGTRLPAHLQAQVAMQEPVNEPEPEPEAPEAEPVIEGELVEDATDRLRQEAWEISGVQPEPETEETPTPPSDNALTLFQQACKVTEGFEEGLAKLREGATNAEIKKFLGDQFGLGGGKVAEGIKAEHKGGANPSLTLNGTEYKGAVLIAKFREEFGVPESSTATDKAPDDWLKVGRQEIKVGEFSFQVSRGMVSDRECMLVLDDVLGETPYSLKNLPFTELSEANIAKFLKDSHLPTVKKEMNA